MKAAKNNEISDLKGSQCSLEKFLRRNETNSSVRLHRKAASVIASIHIETMKKPRTIVSNFSVHNIYNEDESRKMFCMGPNRHMRKIGKSTTSDVVSKSKNEHTMLAQVVEH